MIIGIKCTDPRLGERLGAYELGILDQAELEEFEVHLLACDHCFQEATDFVTSANTLRAGEGARALVEKMSSTTQSRPRPTPSLRPILAGFVVVVLGLGTVFGIRSMNQSLEVQTIHLAPHRAPSPAVLESDAGTDAVIHFVIPDAARGARYHIRLEGLDGIVLIEVAQFGAFDDAGLGQLRVPERRLRPGGARLLISPAGEPVNVVQEYRLRID